MSTVTVVATVESTTTPPRVRLDVTDIGSPNITSVTVTRLNPDGRVVPVRTLDGNPLTLTTSGANRIGLLYDYEAPHAAPVTYSTQETPTSTSAEVTIDDQLVWLIHPGVPALSMPVTVMDMGPRARTVQRGVFRPLGRVTPVVVSDGARKSPEYSLSLITQTDSERAALIGLVSDTSPLLLNLPPGYGLDAEYVAVGDLVEQRPNVMPTEQLRTWAMTCTVVDRPAGGSQSTRTYTDLLAYATYSDLAGHYSSYFDLLAGP